MDNTTDEKGNWNCEEQLYQIMHSYCTKPILEESAMGCNSAPRDIGWRRD
jgi:hypothetical protein